MTQTINRSSRPHRPHRGFTDEWMTPPELLAKLGPFDLDPCYPRDTSIPCHAAKHFTLSHNGLAKRWHGMVWLNPPYGPQTWKWIDRLADHGNGIALIFARTETEGFFRTVWDRAAALLFLRGRLHFHGLDGQRARGNAGGPSVLAAYGMDAVSRLRFADLRGQFIALRSIA